MENIFGKVSHEPKPPKHPKRTISYPGGLSDPRGPMRGTFSDTAHLHHLNNDNGGNNGDTTSTDGKKSRVFSSEPHKRANPEHNPFDEFYVYSTPPLRRSHTAPHTPEQKRTSKYPPITESSARRPLRSVAAIDRKSFTMGPLLGLPDASDPDFFNQYVHLHFSYCVLYG